jgi:LPXTG-motif cell wall-anchored protein
LYREFTSEERGTKSLHLIVDEAHNYLSHQNTDGEDPIAKTCIETFEGIIKEGRKFFILKLHDGEVEQINGKLNETKLEIEVDQFSTFVLAYEDVETSSSVPDEPQPPTAEKDETPKTGVINIPVFVWVGIASIALIAIVNTKKSSKHSK